MRPLRPCVNLLCPRLALLLGFLLLVGLSGCGPAPSDHAAHIEPQASVAAHEARGAGRAGGSSEGLVPLASSHAPLAAPARSAAPPSVPLWMAPAPASPEVPGRLRALETWAQQPRTGSVDPLLLAVDDPDERVRAQAFALLDDDWARELAAEPLASQGHAARGER